MSRPRGNRGDLHNRSEWSQNSPYRIEQSGRDQMVSPYEHNAGLPSMDRENADQGASTDPHQEASTPEDSAGPGPTRLPGEDPKTLLGRRPTLGALIGWYVGLLPRSRSRRRGIDGHLLSPAGLHIARRVGHALTTESLVEHARRRRASGIHPFTIGVDFSLIRAVLESAKEHNLISLDLEVVDRARQRCKTDGLISRNTQSTMGFFNTLPTVLIAMSGLPTTEIASAKSFSIAPALVRSPRNAISCAPAA